jgi:Transglycosylase SLT domain
VLKPRRRPPLIRLALVAGLTLITVVAPVARISATPHMRGALRPEALREQVVRLFDRLDHVSRVIERVRTRMASVEERISDLSRQIEEHQQLLNRRAAEAYMAGRASGIESVLGASSITALGDALEYLDAISQNDHDLLVSLRRRRGELELEQGRLGALEEELRERREWLEATASDLVETLRLQQVLLQRGAEETALEGSVAVSPPSPSPLPSPSPPGPPLGGNAVMELIRERFSSLGSRPTQVALCVAEAESGFDALAVNPSTGAAGVFQFLPSTWESLSELAGWSSASMFDARANVAVAAWTVARYGWHPWRSVATGCGA